MAIDPEIEWHLSKEWTEYRRIDSSIPVDELVYAVHLHYINQPSWCSCDVWCILLDEWCEFVNRTPYVDIEATLLTLLEREVCAEADAEIIRKLNSLCTTKQTNEKSWLASLMNSFFHGKQKHR